MKKYIRQLGVNCWILVLLSLAGCKESQDKTMRLVTGWEFAIPGSSYSQASSAELTFKPLTSLSNLTAVAPKGGVIILRNIFHLDQRLQSAPVSLMLGRIVKADKTYLNGSFLGATGNFPPHTTNPWNINRIYAVPKEILKNENELIVEIYFEPGRGGIFDDPVIGNRKYLENFSDLRTFYYVDTYKISSVVSFLAAIIFLLIYLKRKKDKQFLYFSIAIFSFSVWGIYHFIWSLPFLSNVSFFDSLLFQKILWIALFSFGYANPVFIYEFLDRHKYKKQLRIVQALFLITIAGICIVWTPQMLESFRKTALLGTFFLAALTMFWIITAIRQKVPYAKSIMFAFLLFTIFGFTDILIDVLNLYLPYSAPVATPLYLSWLGLIVINQYVNANNEVERMSKVLDVKNAEIANKNIELSLQRERERNRAKELAQAKEIEKAYHELKTTQTQLIQQEKMASLGELTAGIAHEIQNPLNFVNNFSEVSNELVDEMKEELATGNVQLATEIADDIKQNLEKINHHGKRADAIVKSMLQHSRQTKGIKEPTDINALCDEYLRLSYHGMRAKDKHFNANFKTDFDVSIGKTNVVPQDIGRVLLNLFNNAFYAINENSKNPEGFKNLRGFENYQPLVSIQTKKLNNKIEILVADNGNGIPKNIVEKIFHPFFTTKPTGEGTGLGLSLSYDILKAHGGEIKVQSEEGEGTTFIIQLPIT